MNAIQQAKGFNRFLNRKSRATFAIIGAIGIVMLGWWFGRWQSERIDQDLRAGIRDQAVGLALTIDPELVKTLTFTEADLQSPVYHRIRRNMMDYGRVIYQRGIYTMALRNGELLFGPENYPDGDPMGSGLPGTVYEEPSEEDFRIFETGLPVVMGPISDEYGDFISSLAPVKDLVTGEVLMVVGIDILSSSWEREMRRAWIFPATVTGLCLVFYFTGFIYYSFRKKWPLFSRKPFRHMEAVLVFLFGLIVTLVLAWIVYTSEVHERKFVFNQQADLQAEHIRETKKDLRTDFLTLQRFMENSDHVTQEEFASFTRSMAMKPLIRRVLYASFGSDSTPLEIRYALPLVSCLENEEITIDSIIRLVARESYHSHLPAASSPVSIPAVEHEEKVIIIAYPMNIASEVKSHFSSLLPDDGFIVVDISLDAMVQSLVLNPERETGWINTILWDLSDSDSITFVASTIFDDGLGKEMVRENLFQQIPYMHVSPVFVYGRTFAIVSRSLPLFDKLYPIYATWITVTTGILIFGFIALFIGFLRNQHVTLERLVDQRTAELRERMEELAEAKEKAESGDRLKTAFMHNISHEVRTPLNSILGFGGLILENDIPEADKTHYLEILKNSSKRLLDTITNYMDISLIESGNMHANPTPFRLDEMFHSLVRSIQDACDQKGLTLNVVLPPEDLKQEIFADRELLEKVFYHVMDNAVKFTAQGHVTIGYTRIGDGVTFFVEDSGAGISQEEQPRVFLPFMQEHADDTRGYEGSGLGLTIAHKLISFLGGKMRMHSEKGEGTRIEMDFPLNRID